MNTRIATILAQEDIGEAGTKTIEINLRDIISRMTIILRTTNVAEIMGAHPAANITKIELVDGSDVLFSLNGHQAQAVNFYQRDKKPYNYIDNIAGHVHTAVFGLDFGRFLYDPMLAFDPNKFINPQLKITWDEDLCQAGTLVNTCEVRAHIFDELVPTPTGFFMTKEIYSYLVQTTGYEYIDLPTDFITQQIYVKCLLSLYTFCSLLDQFRLSEDNDRRVPVDMTVSEFLRETLEQWGYVIEHAYLNGIDHEEYFFCMPSDIGYALQSPYMDNDTSTIWSSDGGTFTYKGTSTNVNHKAIVYGALPHAVMPLLPKPRNEIVDWYDVTKLGSLKLRIKDGAHSADVATAQVITTQYRTYA